MFGISQKARGKALLESARSGDLESAELTQKKAELKLKHKKQLNKFDKETEELLHSAEQEAIPSLEVKHAHAR